MPQSAGRHLRRAACPAGGETAVVGCAAAVASAGLVGPALAPGGLVRASGEAAATSPLASCRAATTRLLSEDGRW